MEYGSDLEAVLCILNVLDILPVLSLNDLDLDPDRVDEFECECAARVCVGVLRCGCIGNIAGEGSVRVLFCGYIAGELPADCVPDFS